MAGDQRHMTSGTKEFSSRWLKKNFAGSDHLFAFKAAPGLEAVTHAELTRLAAHRLTPGDHLASSALGLFPDPMPMDLRLAAELATRTMTIEQIWWRVLIKGNVLFENQLHRSLRDFPWEHLLPSRINITATSFQSRIYHEGLLRDAAKHVLQERGLQIDESAPHWLRISLTENRLEIDLALGGRPLFQRGYRSQQTHAAPLREHIAQALLQECLLWKHGQDFDGSRCHDYLGYFPFAGTGTLGFEWLILALGLNNRQWGREHATKYFSWLGSGLDSFLSKKTMRCWEEEALPPVYFVEQHPGAWETLKQNIQTFFQNSQRDSVTCEQGDFFNVSPSREDPLFLAMNPPFGRRLGDPSKTALLFERIGKKVKELGLSRQILGLCLTPTEEAWRRFCFPLATWRLKTRHFTLGGKQIRAVYYSNR